MSIKYSPSTDSFYADELVYPAKPTDLISLDSDMYHEIMDQINNHQKMVSVVDGKVTFVDRPIPPKTWDQIKSKRNMLLRDSDYTQMPDYPGNKVAWATYRQALRDLPEHFTDPNAVVWPTPPGV